MNLSDVLALGPASQINQARRARSDLDKGLLFGSGGGLGKRGVRDDLAINDGPSWWDRNRGLIGDAVAFAETHGGNKRANKWPTDWDNLSSMNAIGDPWLQTKLRKLHWGRMLGMIDGDAPARDYIGDTVRREDSGEYVPASSLGRDTLGFLTGALTDWMGGGEVGGAEGVPEPDRRTYTDQEIINSEADYIDAVLNGRPATAPLSLENPTVNQALKANSVFAPRGLLSGMVADFLNNFPAYVAPGGLLARLGAGATLGAMDNSASSVNGAGIIPSLFLGDTSIPEESRAGVPDSMVTGTEGQNPLLNRIVNGAALALWAAPGRFLTGAGMGAAEAAATMAPMMRLYGEELAGSRGAYVESVVDRMLRNAIARGEIEGTVTGNERTRIERRNKEKWVDADLSDEGLASEIARIGPERAEKIRDILRDAVWDYVYRVNSGQRG